MFAVTAARRQNEYESYEDLDADYTLLSNDFIALNGALRRSFALTAAIDSHEKNMICSPLSALLPLGKLALGAKGETLDELLLTIGVNKKWKLKSHFKPLIRDLMYLPGVKLDIASRIYISIYALLQSKFESRAKSIFNSSVEKADFGNPAVAAHDINTWVAKNTNGMIKELISASDITPDTSLLMVNAIYFSGKWKLPFERVQDGTFHSPSGDKTVPMMVSYSWYNYVRSKILGAQIIEIPYDGEKASFLIVLPYKKNGLSSLLTQLKIAPELLDLEMGRMARLKVVLSMPKFKMESQLDLRKLFIKLGLTGIFKPRNSDMQDIVQDRTVFVSNAIQKAVIEVTENGTEAAAVSSKLNYARFPRYCFSDSKLLFKPC
ncbi:antichymotrypsin-2-like [Epargyreus clarus]|uniref:antichymotrypsin-2-like n=1 Tax=Epargyreus clarus TaxID=520877 RepID=UPI003C2F1DED